MYGFVYLTTNIIDGKKYVGMCKNTHSKNYLGSGKYLKFAIKKYGRDAFNRTILEECDTYDNLCKAEKMWIEHFNAVNSEQFYNITEGGFGGCSEYLTKYWNSFTKEDRKTMRKWSDMDRSGTNNGMHGKKHSEETKKKIGQKSINRNWGRKTPVTGGNNPRAIKINVMFEDGRKETFDCIKDFCIKYNIKYTTFKNDYKKPIKLQQKYGVSITKNA